MGHTPGDPEWLWGQRRASLPAVLLPVPHRWEQRSLFPPAPVWWDRADPLQAGDLCPEEGAGHFAVPFSLTVFEVYEETKNMGSGWSGLLWWGMLWVDEAALGGCCLWVALCCDGKRMLSSFVISPQSKGSPQGMDTITSGYGTTSTACPGSPQ